MLTYFFATQNSVSSQIFLLSLFISFHHVCVPLLYHLIASTTLRWQHCCTLRNSFLFLNLLLLFLILAALLLVSLKDVLTLTSASVPAELRSVNMADTSRHCRTDPGGLFFAKCRRMFAELTDRAATCYQLHGNRIIP
jgi:hypothetical protein